MDQVKIERINYLAKKSKGEGLTPEEKEEQALLRREYLDAIRQNLRSTLDSITVTDSSGN